MATRDVFGEGIEVRRQHIRTTKLSTVTLLTAVSADHPIRFGALAYPSVVEERFLPEIEDSRRTVSDRIVACWRLMGGATLEEAARTAARGGARSRSLFEIPTQRVVAVDVAERSIYIAPPASQRSTGRTDELEGSGWTGTQLGARMLALGARWALPTFAQLATEWASVVEWRAHRMFETEARLVVDPDQLTVRPTGERLYGIARQDSALEGLDLGGRNELAIPPEFRSVMQGGRDDDESTTVLEFAMALTCVLTGHVPRPRGGDSVDGIAAWVRGTPSLDWRMLGDDERAKALASELEKAMHPEPRQRHGSPSELAMALRAVVGGELRGSLRHYLRALVSDGEPELVRERLRFAEDPYEAPVPSSVPTPRAPPEVHRGLVQIARVGSLRALGEMTRIHGTDGFGFMSDAVEEVQLRIAYGADADHRRLASAVQHASERLQESIVVEVEASGSDELAARIEGHALRRRFDPTAPAGVLVFSLRAIETSIRKGRLLGATLTLAGALPTGALDRALVTGLQQRGFRVQQRSLGLLEIEPFRWCRSPS